MEKIRTDSEDFRSAVARGDRAQIEQWDSEGRIEWDRRNYVGRALSQQAQEERKRREAETGEDGGEDTGTEPSPLDRYGIGPEERLWSGHPLVQQAVRSGDAALLNTLYADERYEHLGGSGPAGAITRRDIQAYMERP